jgi:cytochrome oxidase assembly protein ShyY1
MTPEHDYSKRPLQLFWLDGIALQAIAESDEETMILTQVEDDDRNNDEQEQQQQQQQQQKVDEVIRYPLQPPASSIANFRTTPAIHAGYAVTWFGLSAAGMYMTRKLITKGRY